MVDRNEVAREKLTQAVRLMEENNVDMWVIYSRQAQDPSMELLFNCGVQTEILFLIWKTGDVIVFAEPPEIPALEKSGLYTKVIQAGQDRFMPLFLREYDKLQPRGIALNISTEDARCDGLSLGLYRRLQVALGRQTLDDKQVSSYPMLETLRAVKTESEIAIMRECSKITTDVYAETFARLRAGMSETGVGDLMMESLRKRGCGTGIGDGNEYPLICIVRCGLAHRKPSPDNYIQPGDMMVIDFSVRYNGYTSDIARTVYFLKPGEEHAPEPVRHCVESAIRAVGEVLEIIRPGLRGFEVDKVGRGSIVASGYPEFSHSTGHQVGLECHDGGTVLGKNPQNPSMAKILRENEIYAIEPTVLQDGGLPCAIVEDNVILTKNGCRLISERQTQLIEIPYSEAGK